MTTDESKEPSRTVFSELMCIAVLNTIPFGIGVAASTRVGNLLGWKSAAGAKQAAHLSALLAIIAGAIVMATLMATKDASKHIFHNTPHR